MSAPPRALQGWLPLVTPRLVLRLPSPRDVPDLRRSFRDRRTARAVGAPLHSAEERRDPMRMVVRTRREYRKGTDLSLSVVEREGGRCVGRVGLRGLDWRYRKVESLSYWIDPLRWNRGYATEPSFFLCQAAFRHLRMRRVSSQALSENQASLAVLHNLGFVPEGRERRSVVVKGKAMDMLLFGLFPEELLPPSAVGRPPARG